MDTKMTESGDDSFHEINHTLSTENSTVQSIFGPPSNPKPISYKPIKQNKQNKNFVENPKKAVFLHGFNNKSSDWSHYRQQVYEDIQKQGNIYVVRLDMPKHSCGAFLHLKTVAQANSLLIKKSIKLAGDNIAVHVYEQKAERVKKQQSQSIESENVTDTIFNKSMSVPGSQFNRQFGMNGFGGVNGLKPAQFENNNLSPFQALANSLKNISVPTKPPTSIDESVLYCR